MFETTLHRQLSQPCRFKIRATLRRWQDRARQRKVLQQMTERELRDIGINHLMASREAAKPFWKP